MPNYAYRCGNQHETTRFFRVRDYVEAVDCDRCDLAAVRIFTAPTMVSAKADLCYDSPIDGRPVTSWHARREDLKRNGCIEYDPEMKKDAERIRRDRQESFEKKVEATAKEAVGRLSKKKRELLKKEIVNQGVTLEVNRSAAG
jgi:hypothetical protein